MENIVPVGCYFKVEIRVRRVDREVDPEGQMSLPHFGQKSKSGCTAEPQNGQ